ncbi:MAG: hypothetical protein DIZ80_05825 [endosymbiont of Galathealinum brachiosum]|uniref:Uncharacterized protein n=1 Tax=endosymbiont of Galathealinum brachiosum TaxID=2200906 RepID=A0A370DJD2_9GAMM|nr:MAG: hypothetical protein DIZ80_05825 [endosymbiont of Galathealinum brachiosum]
MTKKTEKKDVVTTEEEAKIATETEVETTDTAEVTEEKTANDKGVYLRVGAMAMFVGVAALILGSIWSNNSDDIMAAIDSDEESSVITDTAEMEVSEIDTANLLTEEEIAIETAAVTPVETIEQSFTSVATPAPVNNFAMQKQPTFQEMRNQQRETVTKNLQKQREMMKASFEKSDKQRQAMMESARKAQEIQTASFQQPAAKQDPMVEVMEAHRAEVMKMMEERRQKFIKEMNQARTTRS